MGSTLPFSGGEIVYVYEGLGTGAAFFIGWLLLVGLTDVSPQVTFQFANTHYDAHSGLVTVDVGVVNKSTARRGLRSPLLMRVTDLHSDLGRVQAENSDNGIHGIGAEWNLSNLLRNEPLPPGGTSDRRQLIFRIEKPKWHPAREIDLVIVRAIVLSAEEGPLRGELSSVEATPRSTNGHPE